MAYLTADSKRALGDAVEAIERASGAEVVVVLRPASTSALGASALAAAIGGVLALAFALFSPWLFSNEEILLVVVLAGLVGVAACRAFGGIRRALTPRKLAERATLQAASAEFVQRGICETRERTGVLVYVAQIERCAAVIADRGVKSRVDVAAWQSAVAGIEASVREHADGMRLAALLRELAPLLASALPRRADDTNELDDGVVAS